MKKNSIKIIVLAVILAGVCAAVAFLAIDAKKDSSTTTAPETSVSETTTFESTTAYTTTTQTTQTTTETTAQTTSQLQTDSSDQYSFVRKGSWYLADTEKKVCYAFSLGKNGNADIAYFNSDNIEGFDAQYYKGDAKYEIIGNKIVFSKLPSSIGIDTVELDITSNSIEYNGKKLKNFKKIKLGNALKCF